MASRLRDPELSVFVQHLISTRHRLSVSQMDLAARLGKPQSYISKTENRERRLDVAEWRVMMVALGADPAEEYRAVCALLERERSV